MFIIKCIVHVTLRIINSITMKRVGNIVVFLSCQLVVLSQALSVKHIVQSVTNPSVMCYGPIIGNV